MASSKQDSFAVTEQYADPENVNLPQEKKGTGADQRDMWRMGKAQEMRRNFRFVSILGFTMLVRRRRLISAKGY
jgi:choline transport protein